MRSIYVLVIDTYFGIVVKNVRSRLNSLVFVTTDFLQHICSTCIQVEGMFLYPDCSIECARIIKPRYDFGVCSFDHGIPQSLDLNRC